MDTINGHIVIPLLSDWLSGEPGWTLRWDTEIAEAVRGAEDRGALLPLPRATLSLPYVVPTAALNTRVATLLRTGLERTRVAVPHYGRATYLSVGSPAGSGAFICEPTTWAWQAGDWAIVWDDKLEHFFLVQVDPFLGRALLLRSALPFDVPAGRAIHPLFYGRAEADDGAALSGDYSTGSLKVIGSKAYAGPPAAWTAFPSLRVEFIPTAPDSLTPTQPVVSSERQEGGNLAVSLAATIRIRGVVEQNIYTAGTQTDFLWWQMGGAPAAAAGNAYGLSSDNPPAQYWLNRSHGLAGSNLWAFDYVKTIRLAGGTHLTLSADAGDGLAFPNHAPYQDPPISAPGLPVTAGQFVQVDIINLSL